MVGFGVPRRTTIAAMRHRVLVQEQLVSSTDDRGQPVYTWQNRLVNVPCKIQTLSGGETEKAKALFAEATHSVEMRFNGTVTESMRLVFGSRHFYIGFIDNTMQVGRFMRLLCSEVK
jgi:SPP1 family predicted phage head-tail adaptor